MAVRIARNNKRPAVLTGTVMLLATVLPFTLESAQAAVNLSGGATVGFDSDDNALAAQTKPDDPETSKRLAANVAAATTGNGPMTARVQGSYTKVDSATINGLDHSDYTVSSNVDWRASRALDFSLSASQSRAPISQYEIGGDRVVLQTSSVAEATLRVRPTAELQLSLSPRYFWSETPLPGTADFKLRESGGNASIGYLGYGPVVPSLYYQEGLGRYLGTTNATKYRQRSYGAAISYKITTFTSLSMTVGRTERKTELVTASNDPELRDLEGSQSATTGTLSFARQLTPKTSMYITGFRNYQPYSVGVNTMIGTGTAFGLKWQATSKLSATLNGDSTLSTINGGQLARSNRERKDLSRGLSFAVAYKASRYISMNAQIRRELHNSTLKYAIFDKTTMGIDLSVNFD